MCSTVLSINSNTKGSPTYMPTMLIERWTLIQYNFSPRQLIKLPIDNFFYSKNLMKFEFKSSYYFHRLVLITFSTICLILILLNQSNLSSKQQSFNCIERGQREMMTYLEFLKEMDMKGFHSQMDWWRWCKVSILCAWCCKVGSCVNSVESGRVYIKCRVCAKRNYGFRRPSYRILTHERSCYVAT